MDVKKLWPGLLCLAVVASALLLPAQASATYQLEVTKVSSPPSAAWVSWPGNNFVCNPVYIDTADRKVYFRLYDGDCDAANSWGYATYPSDYYAIVVGNIYDCGSGGYRFNVARKVKTAFNGGAGLDPIVSGIFKVDILSTGLIPMATSWTSPRPWGTYCRTDNGIGQPNIELTDSPKTYFFNRDEADECAIDQTWSRAISGSAFPHLVMAPHDCGTGAYAIFLTDSQSGGGALVAEPPTYNLYQFEVDRGTAPSGSTSVPWPPAYGSVCAPVVVDTATRVVYFHAYDFATGQAASGWSRTQYGAKEYCAVAGDVAPCAGGPGFHFSLMPKLGSSLPANSTPRAPGVYSIDVDIREVTAANLPAGNPAPSWSLYARTGTPEHPNIRFTTGWGAHLYLRRGQYSSCEVSQSYFKSIPLQRVLQLVVDPHICRSAAKRYTMCLTSGPNPNWPPYWTPQFELRSPAG